MARFSRNVSILAHFDKRSKAEQVLYQPGVIDPNTITPGIFYSALVEQLILISKLDHENTLVFWVEDIDGIRYQLDNELKLRTTSCPLDLIGKTFGLESIKLAPGNKLGMTVVMPSNFNKTEKNTRDHITIFGYVTEAAETFDEADNATALALIGQPKGIAPLDEDGYVPAKHLPDVSELGGLGSVLAEYQPKGDYAADPHEHTEYQAAGDYASDPHQHNTSDVQGLDDQLDGAVLIEPAGTYGSLRIKQRPGKWQGISFTQKGNSFGEEWTLMFNLIGTSTHEAFQGAYCNTLGNGTNFWTWYFRTLVGETWGTLYCKAVNTLSDPDLKEGMVPIKGILPKINDIVIYRFRWKGTDDYDFGYNAKEVDVIFDEVVEEVPKDPASPSGETTLTLEDRQMTALLWQAVKELSHKVNVIVEALPPQTSKKIKAGLASSE
ncbi:MAG: hypothetical protein F6K41_24900 [Symploca sp. SIO3E6]|nr:hypothetical protein [Caldora sp. SIO3E6]